MGRYLKKLFGYIILALFLYSFISLTFLSRNERETLFENRKVEKLINRLENVTFVGEERNSFIKMKGENLLITEDGQRFKIFNPRIEVTYRGGDRYFARALYLVGEPYKKRFLLKDDVCIKRGDFTLYTDRLFYDGRKRTITTDSKIVIKKSDGSFVSGKGFSFYIDKKRFIIKKDVRGLWKGSLKNVFKSL